MYNEYTPKHLDHLVRAIWYSDSNVDADEGHVVSPTLSSELVIKVYPSGMETVLSGPTTEQKQYPHVEGAHYWGIRFAPGIGPAFDDILLTDLKNTSVDVSSVLGINLAALANQLHDSKSWHDQSALMQSAICQSDPDNVRFSDHHVLSAIDEIYQHHGSISIAELSTRIGLSKRHIERLFLRYTGLSPKAFCRTVRIQRVLNKLQDTRTTSLAMLALDCGYADQAHLSNDFKRAMGTSIQTHLIDKPKRSWTNE